MHCSRPSGDELPPPLLRALFVEAVRAFVLLRLVLAIGDGHVASPCDDEEPLAAVSGHVAVVAQDSTHVGRAQSAPLRIVPERGKRSEDFVEPPADERGDVLDDDEPRHDFFDDPCVLEPEATARSFQASPEASHRYVLTRKSARDHVHWLKIARAHGAHVFVASHVGPVLFEHRAAKRILLDLPNHVAHARSRQADFDPSNTGKQRANFHAASLHTSRIVTVGTARGSHTIQA